jgi:FkbM family methyltransferase
MALISELKGRKVIPKILNGKYLLEKVHCVVYQLWLRLTSPSFSLHKIVVNGITLLGYDQRLSQMVLENQQTIHNDLYGLSGINFEEGDIVIDVGANIGFISIYIAKRFPFLKILAFEPLPENFENLLRNIQVNHVHNIRAINKAITRDGRQLEMIVNYTNNSGGGTACLRDMRLPGHTYRTVNSVTLDDVFREEGIEKCKLLKIDCEGSEHEILMNTKVLNRVEYLSGEFHINENLSKQGYSNEGLEKYCRQFIPKERLCIISIRMAE